MSEMKMEVSQIELLVYSKLEMPENFMCTFYVFYSLGLNNNKNKNDSDVCENTLGNFCDAVGKVFQWCFT